MQHRLFSAAPVLFWRSSRVEGWAAWKRPAWLDGFEFPLHDFRMEPSYLVQVAAGAVTVWEMFSWHSLGLLTPISHGWLLIPSVPLQPQFTVCFQNHKAACPWLQRLTRDTGSINMKQRWCKLREKVWRRAGVLFPRKLLWVNNRWRSWVLPEWTRMNRRVNFMFPWKGSRQ